MSPSPSTNNSTNTTFAVFGEQGVEVAADSRVCSRFMPCLVQNPANKPPGCFTQMVYDGASMIWLIGGFGYISETKTGTSHRVLFLSITAFLRSARARVVFQFGDGQLGLATGNQLKARLALVKILFAGISAGGDQPIRCGANRGVL